MLASMAANNPELLEDVTMQLAEATEPKSISLLPADLNTTNNVIETAITSLESSLEEGANLISQQEVSAKLTVLEVGIICCALSSTNRTL